MSKKVYNKDEIIFRQNDNAREMYDILSGKVGVYLAYGSADETLLSELSAGEFLGEMGLIDVFPRSATAVALEDDTTLAVIEEDEFSSYFADQPERLLAIMRQLSDRLRKQTQDYQDACAVLDKMLADKETKEKPTSAFLEKVKSILTFYRKNSDQETE